MRVVVSVLVLLALTAGSLGAEELGQWQSLAPVPHWVSDGDGAGLVFVNRPESSFVFAFNAHSDTTWFNAYSLELGQWTGNLGFPLNSLLNGGSMAYSPDASRLYLIGSNQLLEGSHDFLFTYKFDTPSGCAGSWTYENIPSFHNGFPELAYRPNRDFRPVHAIPGWLYAVGYNNTGFWALFRYAIPNPGDATADGYCPPDHAVIADASPCFIWPAVVGTTEYRLQVSATSTFDVTEIDTLTTDPTFELAESLRLANGTHFWRTASREGGGTWSVWGDALQFQLEAGWVELVNFPQPWVDDGHDLCYTARPGSPPNSMAESLWAFPGGSNKDQWCYSIHGNTWTHLADAPYNLTPGTMMMSGPNPVTHAYDEMYAVFGNDGSDPAPHAYFNWLSGSWQVLPAVPLPAAVGTGADLAYDPAGLSLFATIGADRFGFYGRSTAPSGGGQATWLTRPDQRLRLLRNRRGLAVRFNLTAAQHTAFDIYDATGRVLASQDFGTLPAGEHGLDISAALCSHGSAPRCGICILRLTHGTATETAKLVFF
jgi:hypothetical protein